jgi:hypothetical protein
LVSRVKSRNLFIGINRDKWYLASSRFPPPQH